MSNHVFTANEVEMETDDEFQQQLSLFVRCSNEKPKLLAELESLVIDLPRRKHFLDVGAGGGDLTIPLSRYFDRTTAVEPNRLNAARLAAAHPQFRVWNCCLDDVALEREQFDLVLCSHVLYYIRETDWPAHVAKMHHVLSPGGKLAIILQSPAGDVGQFFRHFTGRDVPVIDLWDELVARYGKAAVEARYVRTEIRARTLDEMTSLGQFLLLDRRFREEAEQIRAYFAEQSRDGGYGLDQGDIVLVVKKTKKT